MKLYHESAYEIDFDFETYWEHHDILEFRSYADFEPEFQDKYIYEGDFKCCTLFHLYDKEIIKEMSKCLECDEDLAEMILDGRSSINNPYTFSDEGEQKFSEYNAIWLIGKRAECAKKLGYDGYEDEGGVYVVNVLNKLSTLKVTLVKAEEDETEEDETEEEENRMRLYHITDYPVDAYSLSHADASRYLAFEDAEKFDEFWKSLEKYHHRHDKVYVYEGNFRVINLSNISDAEIIRELSECLKCDEEIAYRILVGIIDIDKYKENPHIFYSGEQKINCEPIIFSNEYDKTWLMTKRAECAKKMGYEGFHWESDNIVVDMFKRKKDLKLVLNPYNSD